MTQVTRMPRLSRVTKQCRQLLGMTRATRVTRMPRSLISFYAQDVQRRMRADVSCGVTGAIFRLHRLRIHLVYRNHDLHVARHATIVRQSRVASCNITSPATQTSNTKGIARRQGVACYIHQGFVLGNCVPSDSCHDMSRCIGLPEQAGCVPMHLLYSV